MARFSPATLVSLLAFSACSFAQHNLSDALGSQPDLSSFVGLLSRFPDLVSSVSSSGGTILAPSNGALEAFVSSLSPDGIAGVSNDTLRALLTYHVLPETLKASALTVKGGVAAKTSLQGDETFANFDSDDAPDVVFASAFGSTGLEEPASPLKIYSGAGNPANVSTADVEYDRGVVHVISSVLNLPQNPSTTAKAAGLTALVDALTRANLVSFVDETPSLTIFAPTNEAFASSGIDLKTVSPADLATILKAHVIAGAAVYSSVVPDSGVDVNTLAGETARVSKTGGKVLLNEAQVVQANVILSNGVVHVVNQVLPVSLNDGELNPSGGIGSVTRRPAGPSNSAIGSVVGSPAPTSGTSEDEDQGSAQGLKSNLLAIVTSVGAALMIL